jgi:hypothetical protein
MKEPQLSTKRRCRNLALTGIKPEGETELKQQITIAGKY